MTNKEFQDLIDEQPIYALTCISTRVSKLYEQKWELEDRIIKAIEFLKSDKFWISQVDSEKELLNILQGSDSNV